jgi:hypothetical protein
MLSLSLGLTLLMAGALMPQGFPGLTPAYAQVSDEFIGALTPYGEWRRHPRWGEVWVPFNRPAGWRPYTYGRWVYTDDWGWYWVSDDEEADWGWVAYHYGRWAHDPRSGWVWVPGDEWAPAWVDWRRGDEYLGWAPTPPDALIDDVEYVEDPAYWVFVEPRHFTQVHVFTYVVPPQRVRPIFFNTVLVNRTVGYDREHRRAAVNHGIAPAIIAALGHNSIPTYRVQPHVFRSTQGVAGAVVVRPIDIVQRGEHGGPPREYRFRTEIQPTTAMIHPAPSVPKPEPFPVHRGDRGRPDIHPSPVAPGAVSAPPSAPGARTPQQTQSEPRTVPAQQQRDHQREEQNRPVVITGPKPPVTQPAPPARQVAPPPPAATHVAPAPVATPARPPEPARPAPVVREQPPARQPAPPPHMERQPAAQQGRPPAPSPAAAAPAQRARENEKQARPHRPGEPDQPRER